MIKFKDLISESLSRNNIKDIVNKVYPEIVKDLGGETKKIEIHSDIYTRLGAVGVEDLMAQNNPSAEYDPEVNKIFIYSSAMNSIEEIIRSLLHEHTHTLQDQKEFKKLYDQGYEYSNHPFEKAALAAENNWKKYL
jgi:cystathionine beta-lyase/cystathionine gamma-synthase|tara:strand:- start:58 stop:465 length:408 start_codon:yes stop_codon:yes gene_type:complete